MKQTAYICILVVSGGVLVTSTLAAPELLSDKNDFLKGLVGSEFLGVLGVILAITLASSAQLHLEFNKIEEHYKKRGSMARSRTAVRQDTYMLIVLFLAAIVIVVAKAWLGPSPRAQSFCNCAAMFVLLWNTLLLLSLTRTVFAIPPVFHEDEN